ncbi:MAG TPA: hypothetical protein VL307_02600 [Chitinophagaceae bacterium]|nr:hypothetical protein [Chitinophagaceae bacterium]
MTVKQQFFKAVYPLYVRVSKLSENKRKIILHAPMVPLVSFYGLTAEDGNAASFNLKDLAGRKILLVNTASGCGFTQQFDALQQLYKRYQEKLVVLAFPTTDFDRDDSNDEQIALFCKEQFRVSFPIMKKSVVKNGRRQNAVYRWLTDPQQNGWNLQPPTWNFCKYLLNEQGMLIGYFGAAIEPLSTEITTAIEQ